ncbi:MAG: serine hydrolase [Bacteroidota bacterium]
MRWALLFVLWFLAAPACAQDGPELPAGLVERIDQILEEEMAATHQPGAAVVVVKDGRTLIKRGYGLANVETNQPVDPDRTLFRIGSVSKALTGLAVAAAVDAGYLGMDDDVSAYVSGIVDAYGAQGPVTVEHLITHTGGFDQIGLGRHVWELDRPLDERKAMRPSLQTFLEAGNLRRTAPPGERFRYDTYGISLAGLVLGKALGQSYAEAMHTVMFEPLGMDNSFVEADDDHLADLAVGYGWAEERFVAQPYEVYVTTPASSIDATPADMGRLLEALTGGGATADGKRLFSTGTAASVLAPQFRPHPRFTGVTHGLWEFPPLPDNDNAEAVRTVGHGGSMLGYKTVMEVLTEENVGIFMVTNRNGEAGGGPVRFFGRVREAVVEAFFDARAVAPLVAEALPTAGRDLDEYAGAYAFGTFCTTCTEADFEQGAWTPYNVRFVSVADSGLVLRDARYHPTREPDVFVRADGEQELFFGRDPAGSVAFYVLSSDPATFERVPNYSAMSDLLAEAGGLLEAGQPETAQTRADEALTLARSSGLMHEGLINATGYHHLEEDNVGMALLFFDHNARAYPGSWNVHDSLGEALALAGRTEEAIAAYERSLALNPSSVSGKEALRRLRQ